MTQQKEKDKESVEDLLKPRYEVIALWPWSDLKIIVGDIFLFDELRDCFYCKGTVITKDIASRYPHLLRKMHWAEQRTISEMMDIQFIKVTTYVGYWIVGDIVRVDDYNIDTKNRKFTSFVIGTDARYTPLYVEPSTIEKYKEWKQKQK